MHKVLEVFLLVSVESNESRLSQTPPPVIEREMFRFTLRVFYFQIMMIRGLIDTSYSTVQLAIRMPCLASALSILKVE